MILLSALHIRLLNNGVNHIVTNIIHQKIQVNKIKNFEKFQNKDFFFFYGLSQALDIKIAVVYMVPPQASRKLKTVKMWFCRREGTENFMGILRASEISEGSEPVT